MKTLQERIAEILVQFAEFRGKPLSSLVVAHFDLVFKLAELADGWKQTALLLQPLGLTTQKGRPITAKSLRDAYRLQAAKVDQAPLANSEANARPTTGEIGPRSCATAKFPSSADNAEPAQTAASRKHPLRHQAMGKHLSKISAPRFNSWPRNKLPSNRQRAPKPILVGSSRPTFPRQNLEPERVLGPNIEQSEKDVGPVARISLAFDRLKSWLCDETVVANTLDTSLIFAALYITYIVGDILSTPPQSTWVAENHRWLVHSVTRILEYAIYLFS